MKIIQNIFTMNLQNDFEIGSISLNTGQDIEDSSAIRYKNYYKVPGFEGNVVYSFASNQTKPIDPSQKGYIYFYDENHIFLREYPPLQFLNTYFPILFRCPEKAKYIRITVQDFSINGENPTKKIVTKDKVLSNISNSLLLNTADTIYTFSFFSTVEDFTKEKYSLTFDPTQSFLKTQYFLYDKFSSDFLMICCQIKGENSGITYIILDNFKITGFQTLVNTPKDQKSYFYIWFLGISIPVGYTVGTYSEQESFLLNPLEKRGYLQSLQSPGTFRSATRSPIVSSLLSDIDYPGTTYTILDEDERTCSIRTIGASELIAFATDNTTPLGRNDTLLKVETYTVPRKVNIVSTEGTPSDKEYTVVQLSENALSNVDLSNTSYTAYTIHTLDLTESSVSRFSSNCCSGISLEKIVFNDVEEANDFFIETDAFSKNNLSVLEFPRHYGGTVQVGAFLENNFSLIFFNSEENVILFGEGLIFSNTDIKHQSYILCSNSTQILEIQQKKVLDEKIFQIVSGKYTKIEPVVEGSSYKDTQYPYLYSLVTPTTSLNNSFPEFEVSWDSSRIPMSSDFSFIQNLLYYNEETPVNSFVGTLVKIAENGFQNCDILTTTTIGFSNNDPLEVGDSAFENCSQLSSVTVSKNVSWSGSSHFKDCSNLRSFPVEIFTTSIPNHMFENTNVFTNTTRLNSALQKIGEGAFLNHNASFITIPKSVISIGDQSFSTKNSLSTVYFDRSTEFPTSYIIKEGSFLNTDTLEYPTFLVLNEQIKESLQQFTSKWTKSSQILIPTIRYATKHGDNEFYSNSGNESYILDPQDETRVLFNGWYLKPVLSGDSYVFPDLLLVDSETYIINGLSKSAMNTNAPSLKKISFPLMMTSLKEESFKNNLSIEELVFGPMMTTFEKSCCQGANNLRTITFQVNDNTPPFIYIRELAFADASVFEGDSFFWKHIYHIGVLAFTHTSVYDIHELPQKDLILESFAFYDCKKLTILPAVLEPKTLGSQCFDSCESLYCSYFSSQDPTAYDKALNPKCVVLNFYDSMIQKIGEQEGLTNVVKEYDESIVIHNSGYIFNRCTIEDYRIRTLDPNLLIDGLFKSDGVQDAWIRFEYDYDQYYEDGLSISPNHAYTRLMNDTSLIYRDINCIPELYLIHRTSTFKKDGKYYALLFNKGIEGTYHRGDGLGVLFQLISFKNFEFQDSSEQKSFALLYGTKDKNGNYTGILGKYTGGDIFAVVIPHAIQLSLDQLEILKDLQVDIPSNSIITCTNNRYRIDEVLADTVVGLGFDKGKISIENAPKKLYIPSTFDLSCAKIQDDYRYWLTVQYGGSGNPFYGERPVAGETGTSAAKLMPFKDTYYIHDFNRDNSLDVEYILSPKSCLSIGSFSSWEYGFPSPRLYPGHQKDDFAILPNSMYLDARRGNFRLYNSDSEKGYGVYIFYKSTSLSTVIIPKGFSTLNDYLVTISNHYGTGPIKTIWVRYQPNSGGEGFTCHSNAFSNLDNDSSTTIYTLDTSTIGQNIKEGTGKDDCTYIDMSDPSKYDIPMKKVDPDSMQYYHSMESYEQEIIPYSEWFNQNPRKVPFFRTEKQEIQKHLRDKTKIVVVKGRPMHFSIGFQHVPEEEEIIVNSLVPKYSYLNLRYHPFATPYTQREYTVERGVPLSINTFGSYCCTSNTLEIIHFAFTTKQIQKHAFITPNLKYIMFNGDLRILEEQAIVMNAPEVLTKKINYRIPKGNSKEIYPGRIETGYRTIYIPHGIEQISTNSIVAYEGVTNGVVSTSEKPESLRKLMWSINTYQKISHQEPYMKNGYLSSPFHDLKWMKDTYHLDFEGLEENIVCDEFGFVYHLQVTEEGDKIAFLYKNILQEVFQNISKESYSRLFERECQILYPNQTFFVPQYLISRGMEKEELYTVVGIEKEAFANADYFKKIRIPSSVIYIGENIIRDCLQLQEVEYCCFFPEDVTIEKEAFYHNGSSQITIYAPHYRDPTKPSSSDEEELPTIDLQKIFTEDYVNPFKVHFLFSDSHGLPLNLYKVEEKE